MRFQNNRVKIRKKFLIHQIRPHFSLIKGDRRDGTNGTNGSSGANGRNKKKGANRLGFLLVPFLLLVLELLSALFVLELLFELEITC
jgi:hypothetical protein